MKVAIYARVSTDKQENKNQLLALDEYVKHKPEWEIYQRYTDVITGAKATRPELDRMLQDARMGKFDHIIIWKVDRLARKSLVFYQILEELNHLGISYSITTLGIDTSTPTGTFVVGLLQQVAELERAFIIERTNLALNRIKKEIKEQGYHLKVLPDGSTKKITSLGRPKGSGDKHKRITKGYIDRWNKEGERRKQKHRMKSKENWEFQESEKTKNRSK